ncbi:MAG: lectin-like protein [Methylococcales bacterium]
MKTKTLWSSIAFIGSIGIANAAPVQNPANGHWYDFINTGSIDWNTAKNQAESLTYLDLSGHLATISDADENAFLYTNVSSALGYLGATDELTEGTWQWVTGESFSYTNWAVEEPNNCCGGESYLMTWENGTWNDIFNNSGYTSSYFVEYEAVSAIPVPGAVWLFGSAILGLIGFGRRNRKQA